MPLVAVLLLAPCFTLFVDLVLSISPCTLSVVSGFAPCGVEVPGRQTREPRSGAVTLEVALGLAGRPLVWGGVNVETRRRNLLEY